MQILAGAIDTFITAATDRPPIWLPCVWDHGSCGGPRKAGAARVTSESARPLPELALTLSTALTLSIAGRRSPDEACCSNKPAGRSIDHLSTGGILYNLERDMSEVLPISHDSNEYKYWAPILWSMATEYLAKYSVAASEMHKGSNKTRFPCCSPGCTPLPDCCKCAVALQEHLL